MSDLNLLPSEAKFQAERMHLKKVINDFLWVLSGAWLIGVIILLVLNLLGQLNLNQLQKKYKKSVDQYKNLAQDVIMGQKVKNQAKVVAMVLKNRFEYGSSMEKIKNLFSDKVIIDKFDLDDIKVYKLEAFVPEEKDFDEVEIKIEDINNGRIEGFKSAQLLDLKLEKTKGWGFAMEVILL